MSRILAIISAVTLMTIAFAYLIRGEVAFGGEMVVPFIAGAYLVAKEGSDEKEERR